MRNPVRGAASTAAMLLLLLASAPAHAAGDAPSVIQGGVEWLADAAKGGGGGKVGDQALGWLNTATKGPGTAREVLDFFKPLTPADRALEPNYRPAGMPDIPSHCDPATGCNACYATAHRKLTAVRVAFEKLRRVNATTQAFTAKSLAFGDAASGVHGVAGIAWQAERAKIEGSLASFNQQYDAKYQELLGLLETALRDVGQCEAEHFDVPNWYDRYGYMYYSFMASRYER